ncbi:MAG TPA: phenylalanine--tRNA ligase subunit beta [Candidatus Pacearchaeota archaeon]|nr:phenylalanine--tRNA ligase subunit beta [Candidatus Pacearchaeota archaeon]HOS12533.1 phenylalanine--tRNA ligase subunit beta [Candidatus Pacearchaeota archaeon]HPL72527.1 phenylalanine--tRNA ligase subunit beta [Candidatus Pacearchaeota archaeon]
MIFSYNWLQSYFREKLPTPEKLAEILTMHSFENEYIEKKGSDYILSIDVLPDRAGDCFSHNGIAREISVLLNKKITYPKIKTKETLKDSILIDIENSDDCLRYTALIIKNVKIEESPKWLKERLEVCGINSINNIVDITNYVMLETGQPMHVFDYDKISGGIITRKAKKGEKISLLGGKEYILDENVLIIADEEVPLAIAGIKGGKKAEITNETKNIVLESANFNHKLISTTARRLNIRTDASLRFEQNIDPNLTSYAIDRAASLIGLPSSSKIDVYKKKLKPWNIKINIDEINKTLGIDIPKKEVEKILKNLGFIVKENMVIEVPTYRQDVTIPENITEEVGRIYGYDKIPLTLPYFSEPAKINYDIFWRNKAKDIMKELGYSEVFGYSFIGDQEKDDFNLTVREIINPVSSYYKYLRPTIIPQLINFTKENLKYFDKVKIFELGKVFDKRERMVLSGAISSNDYLLIKSDILALFNKLGISKFSFGKEEIKIGKDVIGKAGIKSGITFFEIDFEKIQKNAVDNKEYKHVSYHPIASRDISGLIDEGAEIEEIVSKIKNIDLVKSVEVFDVFKGKNVPPGKKSISLTINLQSEEKTLDGEIIDEIITKIKKTINWEERK